MTYLSETFHRICKESKQAESHYVSLYAEEPFYGGSEEGGWWGKDIVLIEYQEFDTLEAAEAVKSTIEILAVEISDLSKKEFGNRCLRETRWLEERGLDDDSLPQPDGETKYFVVIESFPGSRSCRGCRHYE